MANFALEEHNVCTITISQNRGKARVNTPWIKGILVATEVVMSEKSGGNEVRSSKFKGDSLWELRYIERLLWDFSFFIRG